MRTLSFFLLASTLAACSSDPGQTQAPSPATPATPAAPASPAAPAGPAAGAYELVLPAVLAPSIEVQTFARLPEFTKTDEKVAWEETSLSFGLGEGYPSEIKIRPLDGYVLSKSCYSKPGPARWDSIVSVEGEAAEVSLEGGALSVRLLGEGKTSVVVAGAVEGQECEEGASVPMQRRLVLDARRVAGYKIDALPLRISLCAEPLVFAAGAIHVPAARPVDGAGAVFEAANAPEPVALTLRSRGELSFLREAARVEARPGRVSIEAATALPSSGLRSFDVVGPGELTSVGASFSLRKAASKGYASEPIEEGQSYKLFFPEQKNLVDLRVEGAASALGPLCGSVPQAWFRATSPTPSICDPTPAQEGEPYGGGFQMATIREPGECRVEVEIEGTAHRWSTRFTTTPPANQP